MKIRITQKLIRKAERSNCDPISLAVEEQAGRDWIIRYDTIVHGIGEDRSEHDTPEELRNWMAIWDAGGNEGPIEFELPA